MAQRAKALQVVGDGLFLFHRTRLVKLAAEHRLPAIYAQKEEVEAGGLISYGPQLAHLFRHAALYVDRIGSWIT